MSDNKYERCPCGSGKKFKFCCYEKRASLSGVSDGELARRAVEFPLDKCFISRDWEERGLAQILVARHLPDGTSLVGVYLVDVLCLGVKDTFVTRLKHDEVRPFLNSCPDSLQEIAYEDARSVLMGAVEFAKGFGFAPGEGWSTFGRIVESDRTFVQKFDFGKDGQPFYIQGPHDDAQRIMKQLMPLVKEGRAHYLSVADAFLDDIVDESDDETDFAEWCDEISCLLEDKHFQDASAEIEDMLEDYPELWEPLYLKGTCLALEGNPGQAIPFFNQAIAVHPSPEAYLNLAGAHQALFHIEEWIDCLRKVTELDGNTGDHGKKAKEVLDNFASAIERNDGVSLDQYLQTNRLFDRAFEHLIAGRFEEAIRGFSEVIDILPRHVQSYGNLGLAYAGLGDRGRALECLDKAINLDAGYQPAIDNRRILLALPLDERSAIPATHAIDFYGDRVRAHSRPAAEVL